MAILKERKNMKKFNLKKRVQQDIIFELEKLKRQQRILNNKNKSIS
jgi:hypothetical protein